MQPSSPFCGWEIATKEDAFCGDEAVTLLPNLIHLILQKQWCCWEHKGRPLTLLVYSLVISRDAGDTKCGIWSPPPPSNISTPTSIRAWASYPGEGSFILTHNWPNHPPERERKRDQRKAHTWSCSLVSGGKGGAFLLIWCSIAPLLQVYPKDNHSFHRGCYAQPVLAQSHALLFSCSSFALDVKNGTAIKEGRNDEMKEEEKSATQLAESKGCQP